jgi:ornithine carbamoyltransferase
LSPAAASAAAGPRDGPAVREAVAANAGELRDGDARISAGKRCFWAKRSAGGSESAADFGQVISQRRYPGLPDNGHARLVELADHCTCPVINGLTDEAHPCQALADLFTLDEIHGPLEGKRLAYIGDANNVARSLAVVCGKLGVEFAIASPAQYQFGRPFLEELATEVPDVKILQTADPSEAVSGAIGVYTDVWTSMGQEAEAEIRKQAFANYQVNAALMERAPEGLLALPAGPSRRGSDRRGHGRALQRGARAGRQPMHAEGPLAWLNAID